MSWTRIEAGGEDVAECGKSERDPATGTGMCSKSVRMVFTEGPFFFSALYCDGLMR